MPCCVPFCKKSDTNPDGTKLSWHEFPANLELRAKWLKAISRKDWLPAESGHSVICSRHFLPEDFAENPKNKRRLKVGTVPSVFEGYPKYLQKKRVVPRSMVAIEKRREFVPIRKVVRNPNARQFDVAIFSQVPKSADFSAQHGPETRNAMVQVDVIKVKQHEEVRRWKRRFKSMQKKVADLKERLNAIKENDAGLDVFRKVIDAKRDGDPYAVFIMDQIRNFGKKLPKWSESTLSECYTLRKISGRAYSRARRFVRLPNISTLKRLNEKHINDVLNAVSNPDWEIQDGRPSAINNGENANEVQAVTMLHDHCYLALDPEQAADKGHDDNSCAVSSAVDGTTAEVNCYDPNSSILRTVLSTGSQVLTDIHNHNSYYVVMEYSDDRNSASDTAMVVELPSTEQM